MKNYLLLLSLVSLLSTTITTSVMSQEENTKSIHQFIVKDIKGDDFNFADLSGKKIMLINTASKCGLTGQYSDLQKLYTEYKDDNFVIVAFPANNFLGQEPGSDEEIASFCETNYGVEFPVMSKISVKGKNKHALYEFLTTKSLNGVLDSKISWNFHKFLINESGQVVSSISAKTKPYDEKIINWIRG